MGGRHLVELFRFQSGLVKVVGLSVLQHKLYLQSLLQLSHFPKRRDQVELESKFEKPVQELKLNNEEVVVDKKFTLDSKASKQNLDLKVGFKKDIKEAVEVESVETKSLHSLVESTSLPKLIPIKEEKVETINPEYETVEPILNSYNPTKTEPSKKLNQAKVPVSKLSRLFQYGSLATGLSLGYASETLKRSLGLSNSKESNVHRLVSRLSKMRGAAQKLGQMLAIQDSGLIPKPMEQILFQIQAKGTSMPTYQLERVMKEELGSGWEEKLLEFDREPIAAASIGQVHQAKYKTKNGKQIEVMVKVQYPGVAQSIDSDLDTVKLLLMGSNLLPKGLFLDRTVEITRYELKWECDYQREAKYTLLFRQLLKDYAGFKVPNVVSECSSGKVLTLEKLEGIALTECIQLDQRTRNSISERILELCLVEIFQFQLMQTDPNWSNFLYNPSTQQIGLLDFGATREFEGEFIQTYKSLLQAAIQLDQLQATVHSTTLGYFSSDDHPTLIQAHLQSLFILAEPFRFDGIYHFQHQTVTQRIKELIPTILKLRLQPPPEPTLALHRKLSGAFLLATKLEAQINCKQIFERVVHQI